MFNFLLRLAETSVRQAETRPRAVWLLCAQGARHPFLWGLARLRRVLRVICLMSGFGIMPVVSAYADVVSRLQAMHAPDLIWQPVQHMVVAAIPMHIKAFVSMQSVAQVAEMLADNQDVFQQILVAPGLVVLSGVREEAHWLAEIWRVTGQPESCAGRVSVLPFSGLANVPVAAQEAYSWLPAHATKLAQWEDGSATARRQSSQPASGITQTLYRLPKSTAKSRDQIASRLGIQGWNAPVPIPSDVGVLPWQAWRRHNESLFLFFLNTAQGSFLYVHHTR